jgi:hypothetical protein
MDRDTNNDEEMIALARVIARLEIERDALARTEIGDARHGWDAATVLEEIARCAKGENYARLEHPALHAVEALRDRIPRSPHDPLWETYVLDAIFQCARGESYATLGHRALHVVESLVQERDRLLNAERDRLHARHAVEPFVRERANYDLRVHPSGVDPELEKLVHDIVAAANAWVGTDDEARVLLLSEPARSLGRAVLAWRAWQPKAKPLDAPDPLR